MVAAKTLTGLLVGKKQIMEYLCIQDDTLSVFIKSGMPAVVINGRYYAHRDNIDAWLLVITRQQARAVDPGAD